MQLRAIAGRRGTRRHDGREAAVLVPVVERNSGYHLVFIRRQEHLKEHAGQMSFPGGSREPYDPDPFSTAIREAREEIGLVVNDVNPVGELDDITTTSEYVIRPYVSRVADRSFVPDEHEVAEVAVLPVQEFLVPANYEREWVEGPSGEDRLIHAFDVEGYRVWGATGRLVVQLLELTTNWAPEPEA